jgi:serine/threonine-protein kinase
MTAAPLSLIEALRDHYAIERVLGRGGMAVVYLATDLKHGRQVALKVLDPELASFLGAERFTREIETAARLQHPHILPVFDSGVSGSHLWYTMPYVEGESLRDRLRRDGKLSVPEAVRLTREIASALDYAHRHGIIHRDIKPENILLSDDQALVADFGIARSASPGTRSELTSAGMALGSPVYMSPEQAAGERALDGRTDIYSLACVLFEMLAGEPPYARPTPSALMAAHLSEPVPSVAARRPGVPAVLSAAIAKAMAKDPAERFETVGRFGNALLPTADYLVPDTSAPRKSMLALWIVGLTLIVLVAGYLGSRMVVAMQQRGIRVGGAIATGLNHTLQQLTFREALEEWPVWEPGGDRLAYVAEVGGYRNLFLRNVATGDDRQLTKAHADAIEPAWAPDGRTLAFVQARAPQGKLEPSDINGWYGEGGDVWTIDVVNGRTAKLIDDAFGPSFSPDGKRLAFDARYGGPRRIWVADASGHNPRQLTSDSSESVVHAEPRWSPDGTHLVFRRIDKAKSDVVVVDAATQHLVRVTDDNVLDLDPVWSPDGRYIYFASSRGGGLNLWRMRVAPNGKPDGAAQQLTTGAGDDVQPSPARDGERVAFAVRGINSDLWRLPVSPETGAAAGQPEPVVATTRVESRGAWSPDGRTIAFNSDRLGDMNLWLHDVATGTDRRLTIGPGGDYQPAWSPDGKSIAFFSARSGNTDVWMVRVADGNLSRLTHDPSTDTNPFYSPDGKQIAFHSDRGGRTEVWIMNADGSQQRRLTTTGAGGHFLRWAPDGSAVVYRADMGTQTVVYAVAVDGGKLTPLPTVSGGAHMSFSPSGRLIMDVRGHKALWVTPVDWSEPRKVFEFPNRDTRIDYPRWSPDGRWVLMDRAVPRGGNLWMVESKSP